MGSRYFSDQGPRVPHRAEPTTEVGDLRGDVERAMQRIQSEVDGLGGPSAGSVTTSAPVTIVVDPAGDDDPSDDRPSKISAGDYSAFPFQTIQAAIDSLPPFILHTTLVTVNAGEYAGFEVRSKVFGSWYVRSNLFSIKGVRETSAPATGPVSGTATGGSIRTLVLTGAGWTPDDLVGKFVLVTSGPGAGNLLLISENDDETIHFAGYGASMGAGSVFEIQDLATKITSAGPNALQGILFEGCTGVPYVSDFDVSGVGYNPVCFINCHALIGGGRIVTHGGTYGWVLQDCDRFGMSQCGALGASGDGMYFIDVNTPANQNGGWLFKDCAEAINVAGASSCTIQGLHVRDCYEGLVGWGTQDMCAYLGIFDNCHWAIEGYKCHQFEIDTCEVKNSVYPVYSINTFWYVDGLTGDGNTKFGFYINDEGGNFAQLNQVPTITGALGEVSMDGVTDITWAALTPPNSYAFDPATGNRIWRES
jgi:hypothetical protein